jgi:hypothetical protein
VITAARIGERKCTVTLAPDCYAFIDFARGECVVVTPGGILEVNEHDGVDWRAVLVREKEYRSKGHEHHQTGRLLVAVDAVLHGWDYLNGRAAIDLGELDDGRAG